MKNSAILFRRAYLKSVSTVSKLGLLLLSYSFQSCSAQSTPRAILLALSKGDHTLAIVDPSSLKVVAKMPVGEDPHEVIASADGKTAYVSIYGGGRFHELNVLDLVNQKALTSIDTKPFMGPHGLDFADGKVWFTAEGSKAIAYYDPATGKIDWCIGTGQDRTHMLYVTRDAKTIYTSNVNAGTISVLEYENAPGPQPHMEWNQTVINVSAGCEGFDVSPDGKELWTVSAQDGNIFVIDIASKKVTAKIDAKAMGANRLKYTEDGKRVLITSLRDGHLLVYDVASRKETKRIEIGHGAAGILIEPGNKRAFIACTPDNYVVVLDLTTLEIVNHIDVGKGPDGLAWAKR